METILKILKKILPSRFFNLLQAPYHYLLAFLGAIIYRFPSRKIKVIGVTGTKGKTSTTEILASLLEATPNPNKKDENFKVATSSTLQFKIGTKVDRNLYKMSMPGRFFLQKFLRQAVSAGCDYAVIEMTSEGAKTYRHKFIELDGLIFTGISPEHIEAHGSYENYLNSKLDFARALEKSPKLNKILVVNGEDEKSAEFLKIATSAKQLKITLFDGEPFTIKDDGGIDFTYKHEKLSTPLSGKFNIYNILHAIKMAEAQGSKIEDIRQALANLTKIAGRLEKVIVFNPKFDFEVIVDYAHTADSLTQAYEAFGHRRKICVLGSCGGGRDKWKRPQMGKVADLYCSEIILTNEDPYDEDPEQIVCELIMGITKHTPKTILDRRQAIREAIKMANFGDVVIITGKGTDPYLMEANGKKTPWSDYGVAEEELLKILKNRE